MLHSARGTPIPDNECRQDASQRMHPASNCVICFHLAFSGRLVLENTFYTNSCNFALSAVLSFFPAGINCWKKIVPFYRIANRIFADFNKNRRECIQAIYIRSGIGVPRAEFHLPAIDATASFPLFSLRFNTIPDYGIRLSHFTSNSSS